MLYEVITNHVNSILKNSGEPVILPAKQSGEGYGRGQGDHPSGNDGPFTDEGRHMVPANLEPLEPGATDADILWVFDMIRNNFV